MQQSVRQASPSNSIKGVLRHIQNQLIEWFAISCASMMDDPLFHCSIVASFIIAAEIETPGHSGVLNLELSTA